MLVKSAIRTQNLIYGKLSPSSVMNGSRLDANPLCPLLNTERFAVMLNHYCRRFLSPVVCLLRTCRPSAVAGLIITIIVDAVYRIIEARAFSHIIAKSLKRIQPSIANRDSAFAVAVKASCKRSKTSVFHSLPRSIRCTFGFTMSDAPVASHIDCEASARTLLATQNLAAQAIGCCQRAISAFTLAVPNDQVLAVSACERNDGKSAESLPSEVENSVIEFRTLKTFAMINLSHDQFLVSEGWLWLEPKRRYSAARLASLYPSSGEVCNVAC
jgi:hypothetical protein